MSFFRPIHSDPFVTKFTEKFQFQIDTDARLLIELEEGRFYSCPQPKDPSCSTDLENTFSEYQAVVPELQKKLLEKIQHLQSCIHLLKDHKKFKSKEAFLKKMDEKYALMYPIEQRCKDLNAVIEVCKDFMAKLEKPSYILPLNLGLRHRTIRQKNHSLDFV